MQEGTPLEGKDSAQADRARDTRERQEDQHNSMKRTSRHAICTHAQPVLGRGALLAKVVQVQVWAQRDQVVVRGRVPIGTTEDALGEAGHARMRLCVT